MKTIPQVLAEHRAANPQRDEAEDAAMYRYLRSRKSCDSITIEDDSGDTGVHHLSGDAADAMIRAAMVRERQA